MATLDGNPLRVMRGARGVGWLVGHGGREWYLTLATGSGGGGPQRVSIRSNANRDILWNGHIGQAVIKAVCEFNGWGMTRCATPTGGGWLPVLPS